MKNLFILFVPLALFVLLPITASAQENIAFKVELPEATITAQNIPHIAYNNKVVSIADFEINDMGIYILAYRIRNYSLLHLSFDFDTIAEINLPRKFDKLYKDVYNQIHVVSQDSVYWVDTTLLEHIRWEEGCDLMFNIRMFGPMGLKGEAQSLFLKPIYDPVFNMNNEIFVFNFEDNIINLYDNCARKINSFPLSFHKRKSWGNRIRLVEGWNKKVLMDAQNNAFYAVFLTDGITTLKKIEIKNGTAETVAVFGGFPFIENLHIYNGKAYFLYKNDNTRNSRLYEVSIE